MRDRFSEQAAGIEWIAVSGGHDADFTLRDHGRFRHGNAEQVRMDGPQSGRQGAELNALDAAAFDERYRVLEVVVRILRAVGSKDAARRHRLAVDRLDDSHLIGADLDQRHFPHDFFKRKLDQVQAGLEHVGLNADFAFGGDYASRRHFGAEVAPFLDGDFARAYVHEDAIHDDEERDQENEEAEEDW